MPTTETLKHSDFGDARHAVLPKLRLVYSPEHGLASQRAYPLAVGETALGRELPAADGIEIHDRRISRVHAILRVSPELALTIVDNGSKNGTFVNRRQVGREDAVLLKDGDVLRIGDSFLVVRHEPLHPPDGEVPTLIGHAPAMAALRHEVRRIAADMATVMIYGETGTGKELIARALHTYSGRQGDFIAVNCAAIPESLAESELFGHVAGAFTGAKAHPGMFRAAHGGTLLLDEVGELPLPLQAKLLRAIQERSVTPVGSVKPVPCDVRLLSATHRDLNAAVAAGKFREDLYGRLAGILIHVLPLRERREDILLLLAHALGSARPSIAPDLIEALLLYPWPRNVREVTQVADHLRLLGADGALLQRLRAAPPPASEPLPAADPDDEEEEETESARGGRHEIPRPDRERLISLMQEHYGVIRQVAAVLGCSRRQVGRMLEHYQLDRDAFRGKKP